jgi:hypothetical protein
MILGNHSRAGRRQTTMTRSRCVALAAVVVVLGLSACGDPNTTAPLADQPKVIQLASGQSGSGAAEAAPAAATTSAVADSKMAFFGPTEFVYDGELPVLDSPAGSWFFATGQQPDLDRVAQLAAALGAEGEVRALPEDQGGGWAVGPEDYSGAVLTVGSDGMLSWWLSAPPTANVAIACGGAIAVEPDAGVGTPGSSGGATDVVAAPATSVADVSTPVAAVPPDITVPDCPVPQPPAGVPTKEEALATAKQLFADWGYDVNSYQFEEPYADEWSANVNASLMLEGMKAPIMLSVGFGGNGVVTYASGSLATPERGDDYPTIGAAAGLERLKTQQNQYVGLASDVAPSTTRDLAASDAAVAPDVAVAAVPCEPEAARPDCAPIEVEPVTVTLNSVKADLIMQWAADNTIWLLPAYAFGSADGGIYTVIAVDDAYIQEVDSPIATTEPAIATRDVAPAPSTAPAAGATCATFETPTDITAPGLDLPWAQRWVGQCLSYAESEASVLGWSVRVVRQDGVDLPITADFSDTRFNVAVKGDIITEIIDIG